MLMPFRIYEWHTYFDCLNESGDTNCAISNKTCSYQCSSIKRWGKIRSMVSCVFLSPVHLPDSSFGWVETPKFRNLIVLYPVICTGEHEQYMECCLICINTLSKELYPTNMGHIINKSLTMGINEDVLLIWSFF